MACLKYREICKRYDNNTLAVTRFNLEVKDHEFLVLVGPSGCGKSTMLRMTAGLEEISEGELYIGDRMVNDIPAKERDMAMVFQNYALYPQMNVYDNMAFGLTLRKIPKQEITKRVNEVAEILDIVHLLKRKPKTLSGGQRQRVALGRAIVREPQVFLMDEPLSNLDAKLRVQMRMEISKLQKQLGTTTIYVTHDQIEAMTMGDRIVVMRNGIIQQVASPLELYRAPANLFVASFIGSPAMNFFDGELNEQNGTLLFQHEIIKVHIPDYQAKIIKIKDCINRKVILGVRPENIQIYTQPQEDTIAAGEIDLIENLGSEMYLYISGVDKKPVIARVDQDIKLGRGEKVYIAISPEFFHLFSQSTEENLLK
ncbi:putative ABC transporter ATP-binding protein YurJ [Propionispora sp. 2/2-37]|uniref:ABC transporter ATP-binding protein n=1 Tax=Propionispora sp. 2/2-37 TaxID=1677858 RepID=UPI0006BB55A9|nr:sn-glycerol-3-phosphate ABC transporter ATP-binding protein UgpC [Propionispora sp. 2/2-37]CUH97241.1 putative ABC transporter ATP-binding protein YurJ [Propionispora sp. 2/2-37]